MRSLSTWQGCQSFSLKYTQGRMQQISALLMSKPTIGYYCVPISCPSHTKSYNHFRVDLWFKSSLFLWCRATSPNLAVA